MFRKIKEYYNWGARFLNDPHQIAGRAHTEREWAKQPGRAAILNFLLSAVPSAPETLYLEIGVRNPADNFNHIQASKKYSVDPGVEFRENPVDFPFESDIFFQKLRKGEILDPSVRFDVIFIDGLHLADQVERDILNAFDFISNDGFIVLHDCNPPTEWHARENYGYDLTPAERFWNGTTWKAFFKQRFNESVSCACIDSDWGVGIITKKKLFPALTENKNPYYEYHILDKDRTHALNLMSFEDFCAQLSKHA